jgi:hypothetical protein
MRKTLLINWKRRSRRTICTRVIRRTLCSRRKEIYYLNVFLYNFNFNVQKNTSTMYINHSYMNLGTQEWMSEG